MAGQIPDTQTISKSLMFHQRPLGIRVDRKIPKKTELSSIAASGGIAMAAGREHGKLARAAPLQDGDFQDAPGTQVPTGIERAASKLARVAPLQDGD